jgi:tetratricopeptide (TPR) repeat protein
MPQAIRKPVILLPALVVALLGAALGWVIFAGAAASSSPTPDQPPGPIPVDAKPEADIEATYVGSVQCAECHANEMQQWEGSHHDRAMEVPSETTVEGNFDDATFTYHEVTSRFYRDDGDYYVRTEGENGKMHDYKVAYTFGVYPLQQYLVETDNGRLQTLPLCWDNRPEKQGGQRWFHIYGQQRITPDDPLFWTRPLQNWNTQCAECHSTNLKKNYDPAKDTYHTSFAQIDVSCEACHGPGSEHLKWAEQNQGLYADHSGEAPDHSAKEMGLTVSLTPDKPAGWMRDPKTGKPKRTRPLQNRVQMQVCSRCHARRSVMSEKFVPGEDWLDSHKPTLLRQPLYHSDGRIEDEVYVWGSFRQSKMYHKGVRCTDCHNPHSTELHMPKQQMCLKCHDSATYKAKEHHFHEPGSEGASCVNCHMPEETYMQVDPRSDHSFRIPRPDRSVRLGTPNTCNDCHDDQSFEWAAEQYRAWWGQPGADDRPYAEALHAAWQGQPAAGAKLDHAARNTETPTIGRATALERLQNYPSQRSLQTIREQLNSEDVLMRLAAVRALSPYRGQRQDALRWQVGREALDDPNKAVRTEAARVLAGTDKSLPGPNQSKAYKKALDELRASLRQNADRASSVVTRGDLEMNLNRPDKAIEAYRTAIRLSPHTVAAYTNLADVYRQRDNEQQVQNVLKKGLEHVGRAPALHYAMGLSWVRQKQYAKAIARFEKATELGESNTRYPYMLAIAYNSTGQAPRALSVLSRALENHPQAERLLRLQATIARDAGRYDQALRAANKLNDLAPRNRQYQSLRRQIQQRRASP